MLGEKCVEGWNEAAAVGDTGVENNWGRGAVADFDVLCSAVRKS